jgi:hypothetical protein
MELQMFWVMTCFFAVAALVVYANRWMEQRAIRGDGAGNFVAEVWMDWEICQGSTLYRERFMTQQRALRAVRSAAKRLDTALPRFYPAEYSNGRRYAESYGFEIKYGVRNLAGRELTEGVASIWSPSMPGDANFSGEHASAHPQAQLA